MAHRFDPERADRLEEVSRYAHLSRDELMAALRPAVAGTVLDLGSGTGFYTDDVAPHAERVVAVDAQPAMHDYYRGKGVPRNVDLVLAEIDWLPVADAAADAAVSTMTYHEFVGDPAVAELRRVLRPGGRLVIADWSAAGPGEHGPPLGDRRTAAETRDRLAAEGFAVRRAEERLDTFLVVADRGD